MESNYEFVTSGEAGEIGTAGFSFGEMTEFYVWPNNKISTGTIKP